MCGRYSLFAPPERIAQQFRLPAPPEVEPHYNIAPSQQIGAVSRRPGSEQNSFATLRWGLIPFWVDDPDTFKANLINARSETVAEKPSFRRPFRKKRCIIPASGFFEWKQINGKQPYFVRAREQDRLFGFAGLWDTWKDDAGERTLHSATIITREANEALRDIHERMPVILSPEEYDDWLDPEQEDPEALQRLLGPFPSEALDYYPVSRDVNSARQDHPGLVEPEEY